MKNIERALLNIPEMKDSVIRERNKMDEQKIECLEKFEDDIKKIENEYWSKIEILWEKYKKRKFGV